jgi:hypothetical protein
LLVKSIVAIILTITGDDDASKTPQSRGVIGDMRNVKKWSPALSSILRWARRDAPSSEQELVEEAMAIANGPDYYTRAMLISESDMPYFDDLTRPKSEWATDAELKAFAMYESAMTDRLREDLAAIAADEDTTGIAKRAREAAARVVLVPHYDESGGLRYHLLGEDYEARVAYLTLLFLDNHRGYGAKLCRCKLDSCAKFFWEMRKKVGGKPRRSYCSDECMLKQHRASSTERVRKSRASRKKAAKRRRRR